MNIAKYSLILLLCVCMAGFCACGNSNTSSAGGSDSNVSAEQTESKVPKQTIEIVNETRADGTADVFVSIEKKEISVSDLKANDYVVPVYISLEQNAGINYTEWGVNYDPRCKAEANTSDDNVRFDTVYSVNEQESFVWTAWATANLNEHTGALLLLKMTLPKDAKAGDTFPITYASMSKAKDPKPHIWKNNDKDWVKDGVIGWSDGGITVTE